VHLHVRLLVGLVLGIALGAVLSPYAEGTWIEWVNASLLRPVGQIFLRLIFMIVVPMVFSALVVGVYELGRERGLSNVVGRTLGFTVLLSSASVVVGLLLVNVIRPGQGLDLAANDATSQSVQTLEANAAAARPLADAIIELVPRNPIDSAARALDGEMLPLMLFALIFGIALSRTRLEPSNPRTLEPSNPVIGLLEHVFNACMKIVGWVMQIAPLAVFAIVFGTALTFGLGVFASLALYVATVIGGLLLQQFVVYAAALKGLAGRSPLAFFRTCREVYLYAFSTSSSNATLPLSLETAEHRLGITPAIGRFVLTVGSTANQNGTALFEGVTVMFLAQAYGLDLTISEQVRVMVMSIIAGIGTAGVPGGSLPMVLIVAQSVGVPAEGMALVLGVDRLLDMCRTTVNVSGDLVIGALVDSPHRAVPRVA
jgi:DAACS family dicarboxylate/amino acid:cation (Na+ or H+) symporter